MQRSFRHHGLRAVFLILLISITPSSALPCFDYGAAGTNPPIPVEVIAPNGDLQTIAVVGNTAWIVQSIYGALIAVDLSDPDLPEIVGSVSVGDEAFDVAIDGNLAIVAYLNWGGASGVRVVDISDRTNPVARGELQLHLQGVTYGLDVANGLAYVGLNAGGMGVVDYSDPDAPALLGTVDTPGLALDVAVSGSYSYVAERTSEGQPAGVRVVDVSDPENPVLVGTHDTAGAAHTVAVIGNLAYVPASGVLEILDISDPLNPALIGSAPCPGMARNVTVDGALAYLAANQGGMKLVDVSDPTAPVVVGGFDAQGYVHAALPFGDRILVSDSTMRIIPEPCPAGTAAPEVLRAQVELRAYPNPFNPRTVLSFELPTDAHIRLELFDVQGRLVTTLAEDRYPAGPHSISWNGRDDTNRAVSSGVYFASLAVDGAGAAIRQKIALVR